MALPLVPLVRRIMFGVRTVVFNQSYGLNKSVRFHLFPLTCTGRRLCVKCDGRMNCWKCGQKSPSPLIFCPNCNALQSPMALDNYFNLFGIKSTFSLDTAALSKEFRKLQTQLHPDKFTNSCGEEKRNSADFSAIVNRAYRTLIDPMERGIYLLDLHGVKIPENTNITDTSFLLEIMELNEELESIQTKDDMFKFGLKNKETLDLLVKKVADAFERQDLDSAKAALTKLKYFSTIQEKFKTKLLDLDLQDIEVK